MKSLVEVLRPQLPEAYRSELEQALILATTFLWCTLFVVWFYVSRDEPVGEHKRMVLTGMAVGLLLAIGILASVWIRPAPNAARRVLGMVVGAIAITFWLAGSPGDSGALVVSIYFWVIFGNGLKYGRAYLYVSQFVSLVGFVTVLFINPWWANEFAVAGGWLFAMIFLPLYVGALTERIAQARVKAEEALRECVERHRDNVA